MAERNDNIAKWAVVGCCTFIFMVQSIASAIRISGYHKVIEAHAESIVIDIKNKYKAVENLDLLENRVIILQKDLIEQKVDFILRLETLEKDSHSAGKK